MSVQGGNRGATRGTIIQNIQWIQRSLNKAVTVARTLINGGARPESTDIQEDTTLDAETTQRVLREELTRYDDLLQQLIAMPLDLDLDETEQEAKDKVDGFCDFYDNTSAWKHRLAAWIDRHQVAQVQTALTSDADQTNTMVQQMGRLIKSLNNRMSGSSVPPFVVPDAQTLNNGPVSRTLGSRVPTSAVLDTQSHSLDGSTSGSRVPTSAVLDTQSHSLDGSTSGSRVPTSAVLDTQSHSLDGSTSGSRVPMSAPPETPNIPQFFPERQSSSIKLPKLELRKFTGDLLHWREFMDMFTATVDNNPRLQPIEKFNYLVAQLSGEAKIAISGLEITSENYEVARNILTERFDNVQVAISSLHNKLMKLQVAPNDTTKIRHTYDELESCLRSLKALGQDIESSHFVALIMSKLPQEVLMNLERFKGPDQHWTVDLLRKQLRTEICARETVERIQKTPHTSKQNQPKNWGKEVVSDKQHQDSRSRFQKFHSTGEALLADTRKDFPTGKKCLFCQGEHWNDECPRYKTVKDRKAQLRNRCYICLSDQHKVKDCQSRRACVHCKKVRAHHRSLCFNQVPSGYKKSENATVATDDQVTNTPGKTDTSLVESGLLAAGDSVQLQTARVDISDQSAKKTVQCRALLDTASTRSYITEDVVKKLELNSKRGDVLTLNRFATDKTKQVQTKVVEIELLLKDKGCLKVTVNVVPKITGKIHRASLNTNIVEKFLWKQLPLADKWPIQEENLEIELLIGSDYYLDLVTMDRIPLADGLYLLGSKLGWILTGRTQSKDRYQRIDQQGTKNECTLLIVSQMEKSLAEPNLFVEPDENLKFQPNMEDLWSLDAIGIHESPSANDDDRALEIFNKTVQFNNKRYEVTWPWKDDDFELPENYELSVGRLKSVVNKLNKNPELLESYSKVIQDQVEKGVIEKVETNNAETRKHYIPHHAVLTPQNTTTKVRVVYDASAKTKKSNRSLNECMYRGPVFLQNLCGLLIRFCLYNIVLIADIEKAFLQVSLQETERDVTRFLWLKDTKKPPVESNLQVLRFCRVPFGVIASPFLLGATVDCHLRNTGSAVAEKMRNNMYIDNVLIGADSNEEALSIYKEAKTIFNAASMNLREWTSNSVKFLNNIPQEDKVSPGILKVLGIKWNTVDDTLAIACKLTSNVEVKTKRDVLKSVAQVFDPLGFFFPVTIKAKLFLRRLWNDGLKWDDELTENHKTQWQSISEDLAKIQSVAIKRKAIAIKIDSETPEISLLCFVDASQHAYATVVYIHIKDKQNSQTKLLFSKGRLSPQKQTSIPRLELLAMLIGVRSLKFVSDEIRTPVSSKILWSDSQCALHWLNSKKPLPMFVENRIKEIRNHTDVEFRYVNTTENPADFVTRGKASHELTKLWWEGPEWLYKEKKLWPSWELQTLKEQDFDTVGPGMDQVVLFEASLLSKVTPSTAEAPFGMDITRYSSLPKLLRVSAWINRFVLNTQKKKVRKDIFLDMDEIQAVKHMWEKFIQGYHFPQVLKALKQNTKEQLVWQLGLFLDDKGLIRCGGRFSNAELNNNGKWPKLLPKESVFTQLIVRSIHKSLCHAGVSHTLCQIRAEYWILQGRIAVKQIQNKCVVCKRQGGGPYPLPVMPDLPKFRVTPSPPFQYTRIDYFGPMYIKEIGVQRKVWVCLFTCMVVRAIHLEVVSDMSAEQFSMALRRFIARRGKPKQILSDNALQFKAVKNAVDKLWNAAIRSQLVKNLNTEYGIKWHFITEFAPWMGGYYERMIGIVKQSLRRTLGKLVLSKDQLQTLLIEVEATVNGRPLTFVGSDIQDGKTLTPNDFLSINSELKLTMPFAANQEDADYNPQESSAERLINEWKKGEAHLNIFWKVWKDYYLQHLREKGTMHHIHQPRVQAKCEPKVGEVILVKDPFLSRGKWKVGRINELLSGSDGKIRSAKIVFPNGKVTRRSVAQLYPLECSEYYLGSDSTSAPNTVDSESNSNKLRIGSGNWEDQGNSIQRQVPKRESAIRARKYIQKQLENEDNED